jgi:hypothetical protein
MPAPRIIDWKELASRAGDCLKVSLVWSKSADSVRVIVSDSRFHEHVALGVENRHALAAYHHPYAYAAVRGADPSVTEAPCAYTLPQGPTP